MNNDLQDLQLQRSRSEGMAVKNEHDYIMTAPDYVKFEDLSASKFDKLSMITLVYKTLLLMITILLEIMLVVHQTYELG
jgi:hypothetical protein